MRPSRSQILIGLALGMAVAGPASALDTNRHHDAGGIILVAAENTTPAPAARDRPATPPTAGSSQPVSDSVVTVKVKAGLVAAKGLESKRIHVKTVDGIVYLTGLVASESQRSLALQTARNVEGVTSVSDGLAIGAQ